MKSDIIDLEVQIHARTERTVLASIDGDADSAAWLPLSQIEVEARSGGMAIVTMPEWLAIDKGLA